ncbi:hypothetical protein BDZ97DRAFT_1762494 [Flammula alnicola]|nr:hypothetical protein BDZ97DRAFT_1762494 [Flammula alnicola]
MRVRRVGWVEILQVLLRSLLIVSRQRGWLEVVGALVIISRNGVAASSMHMPPQHRRCTCHHSIVDAHATAAYAQSGDTRRLSVVVMAEGWYPCPLYPDLFPNTVHVHARPPSSVPRASTWPDETVWEKGSLWVATGSTAGAKLDHVQCPLLACDEVVAREQQDLTHCGFMVGHLWGLSWKGARAIHQPKFWGRSLLLAGVAAATAGLPRRIKNSVVVQKMGVSMNQPRCHGVEGGPGTITIIPIAEAEMVVLILIWRASSAHMVYEPAAGHGVLGIEGGGARADALQVKRMNASITWVCQATMTFMARWRGFLWVLVGSMGLP